MYLKAQDTISGQEAKLTMAIKNRDGTSTIELMAYGKSIEATCKVNKTSVKTLGKRGEQFKPNSWSGSGSLTIYYITSRFRQMCLQYIKTGIPVYFDITVINDDPASSVGKQTVVIRNCTLDECILAKADVDSDVLDETLSFTFDDADMLDEFGEPVLAVA